MAIKCLQSQPGGNLNVLGEPQGYKNATKQWRAEKVSYELPYKLLIEELRIPDWQLQDPGL